MSQPRWVRLTHRLLNISQVEEVCVHSTTQAVPLFTFHYLWFHSWQLDVKTWEGCACEFHSPKHLWASGVGERTGWTCKVAGAFLYRWWIVHLIKKIQSVKTYVITFSFLLVLFSYSWAFVTYFLTTLSLSGSQGRCWSLTFGQRQSTYLMSVQLIACEHLRVGYLA